MFPSCFIPLVLPLDSDWLTVPVWPSVLLLCLSCLCPQIYKEQLNTRVVLVAVETWTDRDRIHIHPDPLQMLHDFSRYRQHHIKQHADAVHLLSYVPLYNGLDYHTFICSSVYLSLLAYFFARQSLHQSTPAFLRKLNLFFNTFVYF